MADDEAPLVHGGDLAAARALFPHAPEPLIDLSTGINPYPYPIPPLPSEAFTRLPEPEAIRRLAAIAAKVYGAPSDECVVAAPGTQILLPLVAGLARPGRAAILGPTYDEHARVAALAGHKTTIVSDPARLADADLAIVANPNNPDGRVIAKVELLSVAKALHRRDGLLVVDEAFMDVGPSGASLAGEVGAGNIVMLRSFGKFFGLPGVRLGFAIAAPPLAARLNAWLGPWAVSGPALAVAQTALADTAWADAMRTKLASEATRLDALLREAGLRVSGGTSLFRLIDSPAAGDIYHRLGHAGIIVRHFPQRENRLRFGLPPDETAWVRLRTALMPDAPR